MERTTAFVFGGRRRPWRYGRLIVPTIIALFGGIVLYRWASLPVMICVAAAIVTWITTNVLWQVVTLGILHRRLQRASALNPKADNN
jgi:hypothetical protein